ncbi:MAG: choice-of-anchor J domain-containing protein [Bacteroidales bacterium]|nr:choice-of-anchor J domain-containing protein [Bacteroidales bacterium]
MKTLFKSLIYLMLLVVFSFGLQAQQANRLMQNELQNAPKSCPAKLLPYSEDFTTSPQCWTQTYTEDLLSDRWSHSADGNWAGGNTGEMVAGGIYAFGLTRLITPLIRLDDVEMVELSFKHFFLNHGVAVTLKLQCSSNLVNWTDLPFSHSGGNIDATTQTVRFVPMADSLYFAWVIHGYHYVTWFVDDVSITEVCLPKELPYSENFTTSPQCWTQTHTEGISSDRWVHSMTANAEGSAGEMRANFIIGDGVSHLISPLIRFDNVEMARLSFKHYYDNYSTGVTIKLQCSSDLVNWTDLPFSHSGGDITATTQTVHFAPMADSLYFAWVIDGNHNNITYWFIDDVSIVETCLPKVLPYTQNFTTSPECWTQTHTEEIS